MTLNVASLLMSWAWFGVLIVAAQFVAVVLHRLRRRPRRRRRFLFAHELPKISVLKPLCGVDDDLVGNLETFAALDYPDFELLLGVKNTSDPAYPLALEVEKRWPKRVRVIVQRGEPGLNPKVNQLIGLAQAARADILVVSDSNIRVSDDYLFEIADRLADPDVGLVTHPIVGAGEEALGAVFDGLHLSTAMTPGVLAAKVFAQQDIVIGKSMAFRRRDLTALGGFAAFKDVLAEDYVMGRAIETQLDKRVAVATSCIRNVTRNTSLRAFFARYQRWSILQRQAVGLPTYLAQLSLNPIALATMAALLAPVAWSQLLAITVIKTLLDASTASIIRDRGYAWRHIALIWLKDLLMACAWWHGLFVDTVMWRGNRLRVAAGTRLHRDDDREIIAAWEVR